MGKEARALIRRMYAVENVPDGHKLSVEDFLRGPYARWHGLNPKEVEKDIHLFEGYVAHYFPEAVEAAEFDAMWAGDVSMIRFWSYGHVAWGSELCDGVEDREAVYAALLHHLLEGMDPARLMRPDGDIKLGCRCNTLGHLFR